MSFLVDTDICSAYLKNVGIVINRFLQYTGRLHISAITLGELSTWASRSKAPPQRLQSLLSLLNDVTVLVVDDVAAWKFGEVEAGLLDAGYPSPDMDLLIASTALVHGLTLVTDITIDYGHVPGLAMVDWLVP